MYDNQQTRRWCLRAIGGAVGGAALLGTASADEHIVREEAVLTDEAHGLDTGASGHATFELNLEEGTADYELHIDRICDPTMAHIHLGGPDEDGPVVVWLYPEDVQEPRHIEGLFQGLLAEGTITADDFVGPWEGLTFEETAASAEEAGGIYVNVHTVEHPGGEIRGQIEPVEEPPADEDDDADDAPPGDDDDEDDEQPTDDGDGDDAEDDDDGDQDPVTTADEAELAVADFEVAVGNFNPDEEYVILENTGDRPIDMSGWVLRDRYEEGTVDEREDTDPFTFPDGFMLEPGAQVTIWSGVGTDDDENLYWGQTGQNIWLATGDVIIVLDANGDTALEHEYEDQTSSISIAHRIGFSRSDPTARFGLHRF